MNATLSPVSKISTRAKRVPLFASGRAEQRAPRMASACNLISVFERTLGQLAERFSDKYVAPIVECEMEVRVEEIVLRRTLGFILEALHDTGIWGDGEERCISPVIYECLSGYGAALELSDETVTLSHELMSQLAQKNSMPSPELPGWQLVRACDYIQIHGGRLYVSSPISEHNTGTSISLFLPLSIPPQRSSVRLRREKLLVLTPDS